MNQEVEQVAKKSEGKGSGGREKEGSGGLEG